MRTPKNIRNTQQITHRDVDWAVDDAAGNERIFKTFADAAGFAVSLAATSGRTVNLDVLCYSLEGARSVGCEDEYLADPEASVTTRLKLKVENIGHVP